MTARSKTNCTPDFFTETTAWQLRQLVQRKKWKREVLRVMTEKQNETKISKRQTELAVGEFGS